MQLFERAEENRWYNIYNWNPLSAATCRELHTREDHTRDFFVLLQRKFSASQFILSFLLIFSLTAAELGQHYQLLFTWLEESICSHSISAPFGSFSVTSWLSSRKDQQSRIMAETETLLVKMHSSESLSLLCRSSCSWENPHSVLCSALGPQRCISESDFWVLTYLYLV